MEPALIDRVTRSYLCTFASCSHFDSPGCVEREEEEGGEKEREEEEGGEKERARDGTGRVGI